ncbi:hypothetical protein SAMN02745181_0485 [Rubritalea squalenifaciens DSM 18772]|uniref:Uncharacterized protein n=2 Tax=Rubritalea squalenifaciens TaxID=407226 RepID=A0A1M6CIQ0_9BACT|nr:hypothetical protein SAMN02745181_0485 [Rubritalea squalenifaciens DSM 18772]
MGLVDEVRAELNRLNLEEHRSQQGIWATPKQMKHLTKLFAKLFAKAASLNQVAVADFSRCVNDIAPLDSSISKLAEKLYVESKNG